MAVTLRVIGDSGRRSESVSWTMKGKGGTRLELVTEGAEPGVGRKVEAVGLGDRFAWALLEAEYLWRGLDGHGVEDHQLEGAECVAVFGCWDQVTWEDPWMVPLLREVAAGKMSQVRSWREMGEDLGIALNVPGTVDFAKGFGLERPFEDAVVFLRGALRLMKRGLGWSERLSRQADLGACRFMVSEVLAHESMAYGVMRTLAASMGVEEEEEEEDGEDGEELDLELFQV